MERRIASPALGFQITFLVFAAMLLNAPLDKYVLSEWQWARDLDLPIGRVVMFLTGGGLLLAIPALRRACSARLAVPIAPGRRHEVLVGLLLNFIASLGVMGAIALWHFAHGGEPALARAMGDGLRPEIRMAESLVFGQVVMQVFIAGLIGPIVEELVFRGFLYSAWKAAWGWVAAAVASSLVFALFHGLGWPQFMAGLVFVGAMRRGGSIRASIYVHALFNLLCWYPLLGQVLLPAGRSTGELHLWTFHLVCLAGTAVALPWYLWSARDARIPRQAD